MSRSSPVGTLSPHWELDIWASGDQPAHGDGIILHTKEKLISQGETEEMDLL